MACDRPAVIVNKVLERVARDSHCTPQCAQTIAPYRPGALQIIYRRWLCKAGIGPAA
jgi:hypothetical protein